MNSPKVKGYNGQATLTQIANITKKMVPSIPQVLGLGIEPNFQSLIKGPQDWVHPDLQRKL